jgi:tyrosyl-tRNA synthetase
VQVPRADLEKGLGVLSASVLVGFVQSTGEARRQIKGGGLKVNDVAVTDERRLLTISDLTGDGVIKLSFGKKRHVLIRPV